MESFPSGYCLCNYPRYCGKWQIPSSFKTFKTHGPGLLVARSFKTRKRMCSCIFFPEGDPHPSERLYKCRFPKEGRHESSDYRIDSDRFYTLRGVPFSRPASRSGHVWDWSVYDFRINIRRKLKTRSMSEGDGERERDREREREIYIYLTAYFWLS